jgi:xanthine dehydrogenase accessory factor
MRHVLDRLIATLQGGEPVVLCTIIRKFGSAPRKSGARMVVFTDGSIIGSVGGGTLEEACRKKAGALLQGATSLSQLHSEPGIVSGGEEGMECGGSASVLLQLFDGQMLPILERLQSEYRRGLQPMLLTVLPQDGEPSRLLLLDSEKSPDVPLDLRMEITRKTRRAPFLLDYQGQEILVEPLVRPGTVYLAGGGHVALAVAELAAFAGFEIVVMDDRRELVTPERYPMARERRILSSFAACLENLGSDDYVVIVTRDHQNDRDVLAQALGTRAGYIGMVGSRKKRAAIYGLLQRQGFTEQDLTRVHCPIGLAIGADTPQEVAISIVAELVQVRAKMAA